MVLNQRIINYRITSANSNVILMAELLLIKPINKNKWKWAHKIQKFIKISEKFNADFASRSELETDKTKFSMAPHCWFLGALMDRGMPFTKAWNIPYEIAKREFGNDTRFSNYAALSLDDYIRIFDTPPYLHRYKLAMAQCFYLAVQKIQNDYDSDVTNIWKDNPGSYEIIDRLKDFKGVGDKIATMCCNSLSRLGVLLRI